MFLSALCFVAWIKLGVCLFKVVNNSQIVVYPYNIIPLSNKTQVISRHSTDKFQNQYDDQKKKAMLFIHLYDTLENTNQHSDSKRLSDCLRNSRCGSKEQQKDRTGEHMKKLLMAVTTYRYVYESKLIRLYPAKNVWQESCFYQDWRRMGKAWF